MKQLQDIVKTLHAPHVEGNTAVEILDVTADSRAVKAGSLFIALDGATVDGHNYVNKAVEAGADLAIGSRYVPGGKTENWPIQRQILSRGANIYTRVVLGTAIKDITAGFRAYRREALQRLNLEGIESKGYVFQVDLAWRSEQAGLKIVEVPITFVEREVGASKMTGNIIFDSMRKVTTWGVSNRINKLKQKLGK